jgi:type IX secretion system PorP/SprF family membrane protein
MKKQGLPLFFSLLTSLLWGQQLSYYTQFRNAQGVLNPASVSSDYFLYEYNTTVQATYRGQWVENPETPRTVHLSIEHITDLQGRRAFELLAGLNIVQDKTGPLNRTGYYARMGSVLTEDPYYGAFSVAMSIGALQYQIRADRLIWADPTDVRVPEFNVNQVSFDIGIGAFYYKRLNNGDNIYAGISVPQLMGSEINFVKAIDRDVRVLQSPHFYATGGWYHFVNDEAFVEVSAWAKHTNGVPLNLSLIGRFQPVRTFWVGGGLNVNGMTHLEVGLNIPDMLFKNSNLKIAYAIDYNVAAFGLPLGTSHEITLAYMFDTH